MTRDASNLFTLRLIGSDPYSWGEQHGRAFANQIRELATIRGELLQAAMPNWSPAEIAALCDEQLRAIAEKWPRLMAELQGMAGASGVGLRELVVVNAYTDLKDFSDAAPLPADAGGCSALAAIGPHVFLAGQTWDMHASALPYTLLLEIPDAPQPVRVLTVTGCVGLSGLNAAGVSVMINNLQSSESNRRGMPWNGLVRLMLEQPTARAAVATLAANLPGSGRNFLVADREEAFLIETTGRRQEQIGTISRDRPGYLFHTNHYLGKLKSTAIAPPTTSTSRPRLAGLEQYVAGHPIDRLTGDDLRRAFIEQGALCDCVNLPAKSDPHAPATCGGLVVDYRANRAYAFRGKYAAGASVQWDLP